MAILGPNGSGKSTLARHLNVLLLPDEGKVWIDGKDTQAKERLYEIRSRVGMVFQNPDNQIIGTSVEEDVAFGPENKNVEPEKIRKIVEDVLRKVRLWEKRKTPPSKLSGGQKQRLATADALAGIPECLVLDEPTAMLDPSSRKEVINIVKELNQKEGMTIILITHHTDEVVDADRIILMKDGKIIGDDTPKKIFADHSLLKSAKMDIPPVVELSMRLKKQNIGLDEPVLHEQEMIRKITELYRSKCGAGKMLQGKHITFSYPEPAKGKTDVLADVSFEIREHDFIGLIGASGSGKTTLIKHLNGLLKAESGEILFKGENIYSKKYPVSELRKKVGLVFQYPEQQLFGRTILKDVMYGPLNLGMSEEEAGKSAKESLELVGISEEYYQMSPMELSGGQKRCVAIAGVLAMQPEILVLDEPAAGLDPETKHEIFELLCRIREKRNNAIVLVSHHMEDVAQFANRVWVMYKGKIAMDGTPEEVYSRVEELEKMNIGIPQITHLTYLLIKEGIPLPRPAISVEEAEKMLAEILKEEKPL